MINQITLLGHGVSCSAFTPRTTHGRPKHHQHIMHNMLLVSRLGLLHGPTQGLSASASLSCCLHHSKDHTVADKTRQAWSSSTDRGSVHGCRVSPFRDQSWGGVSQFPMSHLPYPQPALFDPCYFFFFFFCPFRHIVFFFALVIPPASKCTNLLHYNLQCSTAPTNGGPAPLLLCAASVGRLMP